MTRDRLSLFDTTLRDGQQTQGVQFSTAEKVQIAAALDALGVDYIEGGWPGANPTDSDFFAQAPRTRAAMTAFGMTKRVGRSAENDDVLAAVLDAGTPAVCLVGKTHEFHVTTALAAWLPELPGDHQGSSYRSFQCGIWPKYRTLQRGLNVTGYSGMRLHAGTGKSYDVNQMRVCDHVI